MFPSRKMHSDLTISGSCNKRRMNKLVVKFPLLIHYLYSKYDGCQTPPPAANNDPIYNKLNHSHDNLAHLSAGKGHNKWMKWIPLKQWEFGTKKLRSYTVSWRLNLSTPLYFVNVTSILLKETFPYWLCCQEKNKPDTHFYMSLRLMGPSSPKRNGLFDTTNWMIRVKLIQHHDRVFTPVSHDDS